jgi:DNA repair ATPase RecN
MFDKRGFVDSSLIKIKDKLSEASYQQFAGNKTAVDEERRQPPTPLPSVKTELSKQVKIEETPVKTRELFAALEKRKNEFRLLKRDVCEKLCEKTSSFPEDIKISERRLNELKNGIEKFAGILDELKGINESSWDDNTVQSELGKAYKKVENARLEYIRVCARLSALQRESSAAEMGEKDDPSLIPKLASLSLKQGFKIGLFISLPLIIAILLAALIICAAYMAALN